MGSRVNSILSDDTRKEFGKSFASEADENSFKLSLNLAAVISVTLNSIGIVAFKRGRASVDTVLNAPCNCGCEKDALAGSGFLDPCF